MSRADCAGAEDVVLVTMPADVSLGFSIAVLRQPNMSRH